MSRQGLRKWCAMWSKHLLRKCENTKYLQKANMSPMKHHACPIAADDFAFILEKLYKDKRENAIDPGLALN